MSALHEPCVDCGRPVYYDADADGWRAVEADHACFMVAGNGGTSPAGDGYAVMIGSTVASLTHATVEGFEAAHERAAALGADAVVKAVDVRIHNTGEAL